MNDNRSSQGWWSSLPGVLTASAAAITAIGGLIAALGQTGIFHTSKPAATPPAVASVPDVTSTPASTSATTVVSTTTVAQSPSKPSIPADSTVAMQAPPPATSGDIGSNMSYFGGTWQNINPATNGIIKIQIRISESTMYVRAWAKCRPTDCDWGEVEAEGFGSNVGSQPGRGVRIVTAQFKNNIRQVALTIHPVKANRIRVEAATNFIDQSGRAPVARIFIFQRT